MIVLAFVVGFGLGAVTLGCIVVLGFRQQELDRRDAQHKILFVLNVRRAELHGLAIDEEIERTYKERLGPARLYSALRELEEEGYLESWQGEVTIHYSLSTKGKEAALAGGPP